RRLLGRLTGRIERAAYDALDRCTDGSVRMRTEAAAARRGTRRRAIPMAAAGFAALIGMFTLVSQQALAVNFTTANNSFKLYSNYLQGESAAGFLSPTTQQDGTQDGVAELGIKTAKLSGLCAIAQQDLGGPLGNVSLMITAGDPVPDTFAGTGVPTGVTTAADGTLSGDSLTNSISATSLYVNTNSLGGYGNMISGLNLGQSSETVANSAGIDWPSSQGGTTPGSGNFGLYANRLNVGGLGGQTYGINLVGQITLPKLQIKVVPGSKTQADCS
ncbi:MAG: hypothetical protein J2O46_08610, partial [Nocardioides sp.]|nr:hypothetical protein [Nocardioides sp.]